MALTNGTGFVSRRLDMCSYTASPGSIEASALFDSGYALRMSPGAYRIHRFSGAFDATALGGNSANAAIATIQFGFVMSAGPASDWPANACSFVKFSNGSLMRVGLTMWTSRKLQIGSGSLSNTVFAADGATKYIIAARVNATADSHTCNIYDAEMNLLETITSTLASDGYGEFDLTNCNDGQFSCLIGDVIYQQGASVTYPLRTTQYHVVAAPLAANGTDTAWTGDKTKVDEIPTDDDTSDVISSPVGANTGDETFTISNAAVGGTIDAVIVRNRIRRVGAGNSGLRAIRLRSGAMVDEADNLVSPSTSATSYCKIYATNPDGGGAWTPEAVGLAEVGVGMDASQAGIYCEVFNIVVEVVCDAITATDITITADPVSYGLGVTDPTVTVSAPSGGAASLTIIRRHAGPTPADAPPRLSLTVQETPTGGAYEDITARADLSGWRNQLPGGCQSLDVVLACDQREARMWRRKREGWDVELHVPRKHLWRGYIDEAQPCEQGVRLSCVGYFAKLGSEGDVPYNCSYAWAAGAWSTTDADGDLWYGVNSEDRDWDGVSDHVGIEYINAVHATDWSGLRMTVSPWGHAIRQVLFTHVFSGTKAATLKLYAIKSTTHIARGRWDAGGGLPQGVAGTDYEVLLNQGSSSAGAQTITVVGDGFTELYLMVNPDEDFTAEQARHYLDGTIELRVGTGRDTDDLVWDVVQRCGGLWLAQSRLYIAQSGVELPLSQEYQDEPGAEIMRQMGALGNSAGVPMYPAVWPDLYLHYQPRASAVTWILHERDLLAGDDGRALARNERVMTGCYAVYTTVAGATARTATTTNAALVALYGTRTKALRVDVTGDADADRLAQAETLRDMYLAMQARLALCGTLGTAGPLYDLAGHAQPALYARAGDIVMVPEWADESTDTSVVPDGRCTFHIIEDDHDAQTGAVRLTTENARADLDVLLAQAAQ